MHGELRCKGILQDFVGKLEGLMAWQATVDVWKEKSTTSINQLQSYMDNLLVMQKAPMEKLDVQMSQEGNPHAIVPMHLIGEHHHKKLVTVNTIERFGHVSNGVDNG